LAKQTKSQSQKFRETARALGADQSESAFNAALKKVAQLTGKPGKSPGAKKKSPAKAGQSREYRNRSSN
jgi:hypothetical protein